MAANSAVSPDDQVSPGHNPLLYQFLSQCNIVFVFLYYISEAFALFSLCLHVFPVPRRSALPPFPCFLQQTIQTIHHFNTTIEYKKTRTKGIKNQKAKLRSYFRLLSGSLSVSYASFTATNRSYPSPFSLLSHLRVLLVALIGMQSQRESFVGLPDLFLGGASVHAQHRVQVWTHRRPPRLPRADRRGR